MNIKAFAVLALCVFCAFLGVGFVSPFLPLYAEAMGASGFILGMIFSSFTIARAVVVPFIGPLSDRKGRRLFLLIGFGGYTLATLGYVLATTPFHLMLTRAIQGATAGMLLPTARAFIGDLCPKGEEGKWQGYGSAAFFGGFASGPLIGGLLAEGYGYNATFYAMGGLCLLSFLLALAFLPESGSRQIGRGYPSTKELFRVGLTSRMFRGLISYRIGFAMARGCFFTFLPLLVASSLHIGTGLIGILMTSHYMVLAVSQLYFGNLSDRLNRRALVITGAILQIIFLILIPRGYIYWQLLALLLFGGVAAGIAIAPLTALYTKEGRTHGMGTAMSLETMAMTIGMGIGPIIGGIVADVVNIASVFYLAAGVQLIGMSLFFMFTRGYKFNTELAGKKASNIQLHD